MCSVLRMASTRYQKCRSASECIGLQIKVARVEFGLSQDGLAILAGIRRETVVRIENGGIPRAHTVFAIEKALSLDSSYFVPDWEPSEIDSPLVGPRIRERRRKCRISLASLASAAGVTEATMSRFERGLTTSRSICEESDGERGEPVSKVTNVGIAHALGFVDLIELQAYCDERRD